MKHETSKPADFYEALKGQYVRLQSKGDSVQGLFKDVDFANGLITLEARRISCAKQELVQTNVSVPFHDLEIEILTKEDYDAMQVVYKALLDNLNQYVRVGDHIGQLDKVITPGLFILKPCLYQIGGNYAWSERAMLVRGETIVPVERELVDRMIAVSNKEHECKSRSLDEMLKPKQ